MLGPLGVGTVHLAVDMQRLFMQGRWTVPGIPAITPNVIALAEALPDRTLFTRFVVPPTAEHATGQWRHYYRYWWDYTGAALAPALIEIGDALAPYAHPGNTVDKPTHSAFEAPALMRALAGLGAETLVVTGAETDVCVLGTILGAVDRGFRVVAVSDAMASSSEAGHAATLAHILPRFDQQVDIMTTAEVLAALVKA
jgi:nicotinamidase-related amidase